MLAYSIAILALPLAVACIFWPGLTGVFVLDDFGTLAAMQDYDEINSFSKAAEYVLSGMSGPGGRPLAHLSFLIDGQTWPTDPKPFKRTNILLHALNAVLVFALALRWTALLGSRSPALLSLVVATWWAMHPMQISSVLYVVQRMTELASTFILLGLLLYLAGRHRIAGNPALGYSLIVLGLFGATSLGVLGKESAVLLPVYAGVIELSLRARGRLAVPDHWRRWAPALFAVIPLTLISYLAYQWPSFIEKYGERDFSLTGRLITEAQILFTYVGQIFVPRAAGLGIFQDHWRTPQNNPELATAMFAAVCIFIIAALGWRWRGRYPVASLAALWFLGGHLLESTVIPLELYFEHRNYMPMLGPMLATTFLAFNASGSLRRVWPFALLLAVGVAAFVTREQSRIWGNELLAANIWPQQHPDSTRVRQMAANAWLKRGEPRLALAQFLEGMKRNPNDPTMKLQAAQMKCILGESPETLIDNAAAELATSAVDRGGLDTVENLRQFASARRCVGLGFREIHRLIAAYKSNPKYQRNSSFMAYLAFTEATTFAEQGEVDSAISAFERSYQHQPGIRIRLWQASWLQTYGRLDDAEKYLQQAERENQRRKWPEIDWTDDIAKLRQHVVDARQSNEKQVKRKSSNPESTP